MNIKLQMEKTHISGLAVCTFAGEQFEVQNFGAMQAGNSQPVENSTLFHACSVSKFLSALCVIRLASEQVLDLHEDVNRYLSKWKLQPDGFIMNQPVTLNMLLSHRSGIVDPEDSFVSYRKDENPVANPDLLRGATRFHTGPVTVKEQPGSRFSYSDAGFCVIEQIVRDVTGKTIPQHARRIVFEPLGLSSAFFWQRGDESSYPLERCAAGHDSKGTVTHGTWPCYPNPEGAGLWITAGDLAAITSDFIGCIYGNGRILPQAQASDMVQEGLGIFPAEDGFFFSQGWGEGMQCKLVGDTQNKRGIVVMMNQEPGVDQNQSIIGSIIREFI